MNTKWSQYTKWEHRAIRHLDLEFQLIIIRVGGSISADVTAMFYQSLQRDLNHYKDGD